MLKYSNTKGYKYTVREDISVKVSDLDEINISTPHFSIQNNVITAKSSYSWNGASGPTWDTPNTMLPSLIHDILYQCIGTKQIDKKKRFYADLIFYKLMRERTKTFFGQFRAFYFFCAVRLFGGFFLENKPEKQDVVLEVK